MARARGRLCSSLAHVREACSQLPCHALLAAGGPFPLVFAACASSGARAAIVGKNLPPCRAIRGTAVRFSPLERLRGDRSSVPHEKKQAGHQRNASELLAGSSAPATLPSRALVQQSKGPSVASGAGGQRGRTRLGAGGLAVRGETSALRCPCHLRETFLNLTCSCSSGPFRTPVTNAHLALSSSPLSLTAPLPRSPLPLSLFSLSVKSGLPWVK